jgi:hypothetical protein
MESSSFVGLSVASHVRAPTDSGNLVVVHRPALLLLSSRSRCCGHTSFMIFVISFAVAETVETKFTAGMATTALRASTIERAKLIQKWSDSSLKVAPAASLLFDAARAKR